MKINVQIMGSEFIEYNLVPNARANFMFLGVGQHKSGFNQFTGVILDKKLVLTVRSVCVK